MLVDGTQMLNHVYCLWSYFFVFSPSDNLKVSAKSIQDKHEGPIKVDESFAVKVTNPRHAFIIESTRSRLQNNGTESLVMLARKPGEKRRVYLQIKKKLFKSA